MDGAPALQTHELTKVYGEGETAVHALDGVTLEIERGEMAAIMGPSGSGKSTLLHLLGALDTPSSGEILLAGQRYDGLGDGELTRLRREKIGFVFQFFNLLPSLTAEENVLLPALIAGAARRGDAPADERSCSPASGWRSGPATCPPSSRAASSSASRSRGRCSRSRRSCSPTSPPATWTRASSGEVLRLLRELNESEGQDAGHRQP